MRKASIKWMLFTVLLISASLVAMWAVQFKAKYQHDVFRADHGNKQYTGVVDENESSVIKKTLNKGKPKKTTKTNKVNPVDEVNPVDYYCNFPRDNDIFTMQEGVGQKGWKLKQVQILIRHGDRAPLNYAAYNKFRVKPNFCNIHSDYYSEKYKLVSKYRDNILKDLYTDGAVYFTHPLPQAILCSPGQLTVFGALQQLHNGLLLREAYVQKHKLLDAFMLNETIYVRSTHVRRTYQSAVAFLYGFVPDYHFKKIPITFTNSPKFCENHCVCPKAQSIEKLVKEKQYRIYVDRQKKNSAIQNISRIVGIGDHTGQQIDSLVTGYVCKRMPLPCNKDGECVDPSQLEVVMKEQERLNEITRLETPAQNLALLVMQPFLENLFNQMKQVIDNKEGHKKVILYSGHDLTVTPVIQALGLPDYRWPRLGTRLVFELWESTTGTHFIKIILNGVEVTGNTSFCPERSEDCTFEAFANYVSNIGQVFGFESRSAACRS
uniref:2-phosphoxylose phosphatase 1 n=1 Tax=Ciona savignyi TaxID=51511 RepID=H2YRM6_CIOSA